VRRRRLSGAGPCRRVFLGVCALLGGLAILARSAPARAQGPSWWPTAAVAAGSAQGGEVPRGVAAPVPFADRPVTKEQLNQARGAGLASELPGSLGVETETAVILWDELKPRKSGGSFGTESAPSGGAVTLSSMH